MYRILHTDYFEEIKSKILEVSPRLSEEEKSRRNIVVNRVNVEDYLKIEPLNSFLKQLNLLDHIFFISLNTTIKMQSPIHVDSSKFKYSLNIPIKNYANTYCCFYKVINENKSVQNINFGKNSIRKDPIEYVTFAEDDCELIEKYETLYPCIIDTSVPHKFYNLKPTERLMLLIRLKNDSNHIVENIIKNL